MLSYLRPIIVCALICPFLEAEAQHHTQGSCPANSECVSLAHCPSLKDLARKLKDAASTEKKLQLIAIIKHQMCGNTKTQKRVLVCCDQKLGEKGSDFKQLSFHDLSGRVEFKDSTTLSIRNFVYDGEAPDAFFVLGTQEGRVDPERGIPVPYPPIPGNPRLTFGDDVPILDRFNGEDIELVLPDGLKAENVRWLSVYCRKYNIDFGHAVFPVNVPRS